MQFECIMGEKKKKGILTKWMVNSYLIIQAFLVFCIFMCSYFNRTSNMLFKSIKLSSTEKQRCFHILKFISILLKAPNIQSMFVCQKSPAARIFVFLFFVSKQLYRQLLRTLSETLDFIFYFQVFHMHPHKNNTNTENCGKKSGVVGTHNW